MKNSGIAFGLTLGMAFVLSAGAAAAATLQETIAVAEQDFGGEAFAAEAARGINSVELVVGGQIVETFYDAETGAFIRSETYGGARAQQAAAALAVANISLLDSIDAAEGAVGTGELLEADLIISRRIAGRLFIVDIRVGNDGLDVWVASANGRVIRVIPD